MDFLAPTSRSNALRRTVSVLGTVALALTLSGCQSVMGTTTLSPAIRIVDESPDAPGLDFLLNKNVIAYNVGFGYAQVNYMPVAAGTYTVSVVQDGFTQTLASTSAGFGGSQHYTIVAGNIEANLQLTVLTDQTTPAASNQINVRFLDQATKVGAVDIYFVPSGGKLTTTSAAFTNLTFGVNTGYINLPTGTYQIVIVPTGTVPIATTTALYTGATETDNGGAVRTFILRDTQNVTVPPVDITELDDVN